VIFGMGRGLARCEYSGFNIDMDSSRERFDEAASSVLAALDTGIFESKGPWFTREPTEIRPRPRAGFRNRAWCIAMSPDSVDAAARIGTGMAMFSQASWDTARDSSARYRTMFREQHVGEPMPPVVTADMIVREAEPGCAEEMKRKQV